MKSIIICLFLLLLGYFIGIAIEGREPVPEASQNPSPVVHGQPSSSPKFSTLTELRLHDKEQRVILLKSKLRAELGKRAPDDKTLQELEQATKESLEVARNEKESHRLAVPLSNRIWYLLTSNQRKEADKLAEVMDTFEDPAFAKSIVAWDYCDFDYHTKAAELLTEAIAEESHLFYTYELRLRLARCLLDGGELLEAETALRKLQSELEQATQKSQIVRLEGELWRIRADLAAARGDKEGQRTASVRADEYFEALQRLR